MKCRNVKKEARTANIGFAKWRVKCFYDSLVQGSSSVFQLNICAENPPLRKAENRQAVKKRRFLIISLVKHTTILTYSCAKGHYFLSCNL